MWLDESDIDVQYYVDMVNGFYDQNRKTTEIHIDSIVLMYRITLDERLFDLLFEFHRYLLQGIIAGRYNKYRRHLLNDDINEIRSLVYGEFFQCVFKYKIPPEAPFSKYIKLYLLKWSNVYTKRMARRRSQYILDCDRERDNAYD